MHAFVTLLSPQRQIKDKRIGNLPAHRASVFFRSVPAEI